MNVAVTNRLLKLLPATPVAASVTIGLLVGVSWINAQEAVSPQVPLRSRGAETRMDLPGDFHHYYGQRVNNYKDKERRIAKLDMDADLNYDGVVSNTDPGDQGAFEQTPPGLILGTGEMSRLVIRVDPYRVDFEGEVVITLEVDGINRADQSGEFASFEQEQAAVGRIRVWKDADRQELLLDSGDPNLRFKEWVADQRVYPANLPGIYPRSVFVEGVQPSGAYSGDLRLLITVAHRQQGAARETYPEYRQKLVKAFRTSFDHIVLTVQEEPQPKDFINNNAEGTWITVARP